MSSNMERVAAMPDASLYVNRDGRRADDCVDSHGGGNLIKIPRSGGGTQKSSRNHLVNSFKTTLRRWAFCCNRVPLALA